MNKRSEKLTTLHVFSFFDLKRLVNYSLYLIDLIFFHFIIKFFNIILCIFVNLNFKLIKLLLTYVKGGKNFKIVFLPLHNWSIPPY